jgi:DNA-binding NarL/FixJ family response regulator
VTDSLPTIAVLADDLIWSSRICAAVEHAGAVAARQRGTEAVVRSLASGASAAVIDLNGRAYDGLAAVAEAVASGRPVVAIGQHEDLETRRQALDAGALAFYSYNRFFREGPTLIQKLLAQAASEVAR